jgi:hypothetical protein
MIIDRKKKPPDSAEKPRHRKPKKKIAGFRIVFPHGSRTKIIGQELSDTPEGKGKKEPKKS